MLINTNDIKFIGINYKNGYFVRVNNELEVNLNLVTEKIHEICMEYFDRSQIVYSTSDFECCAMSNNDYDELLNIINDSVKQIGSKIIVNR